MSYFTNLSPTVQNLLMVQFEFFGKIFLFGFFLIVAVLYIHSKKNQKDTPYILLGFFRSLMYIFSWIYIYFTPLFIVWLYPQQSINRVLTGFFLLYRYSTLIIGLLLFINFIFYTPLVLAKLGGVNIQSSNTNKVLDDLLGKYKKYFKK